MREIFELSAVVKSQVTKLSERETCLVHER